jgi:hypothetical protein
MAVGCSASVTLDDMCGLPRQQRHRELPDVVSAEVVATRCAPALPELAIATAPGGGDPLHPGSAGAGDRH